MKNNLKLKLILAVGCFALAAGCGPRPNGPEGIVTVDFHSYKERLLAEMVDPFYSSRRYVTLHADDQELMIGEIGKVVLRGDRIYASEIYQGANSRHNLVVHDADGRALAKIGNRGRGPGEYLQISDFDVDEQGRIHLYDGTLGKKVIYIFTPDGKLIEEKRLPFDAGVFKCTPDGGYLFVLNSWDTSEYAGKMFIKTDADLSVANVTGEYNREQIDDNVVLGNGSLVATTEGFFYQKSPDERLWQLDARGNIEKTWFLDLGSHAIPPENRGNLEPVLQSGMEPYRIFMDFVAPWGPYILGSMYDRGEIKSFVYDTGAGINYTQKTEATDPFGSFVTISDGRLVSFFPMFDGETLPSGLPEELRPGVLAGDPLLVFYALK